MCRYRRRTVAGPVLLVVTILVTACGAVGEPGPAPTAARSPTPTSTATGSPATPLPRATSLTPAETPGPADRPTVRRPVIVIDPGHSGRSFRSTDRATGLQDVHYPNYPEIYEVFDISTCVAQALRRDGYRVLLTKRRVLDSVGHAERAAVANRARADLAISVHNDHGASARFQATYDQRGVPSATGRYPVMFRGQGSRRTVFDRPEVARKSQRAARIIAAERTRAQHRRVTVTQNSFDGRKPLEPGNLALVQLVSEVPWVYNEMGARTDGDPRRAMSIRAEQEYAAGLLAGVEAAVPLGAGRPTASANSDGSLTRCLERQVEPRPGTFTRPKAYLPTGY